VLYFFGDSFTYGQGLEDCLVKQVKGKWPPASKLAFPQLIEDLLQIPHRNLAYPGSSNQQILWTLRTSDITKDDIAIISWSDWSRSFVLKDIGFTQIGSWLLESPHVLYNDIAHYYKLHDEIALKHNSLMAIEHADLWCRDKGIKTLMYKGHYFKDHDDLKVNGKNLENLDRYRLDKTQDGHWGPITHKFLSNMIAEHIKKLLTSSET
jgi:hypothetical protein